ncbi:MAG: PHP-associated domain-containing protein [Patescibacteria group bacterium]|nr:PHP-associated domain-containing protein [Patescibacteria group bacterium]MDD5121286.1 PHP-associated domain-containing protein [Patescibacteria group bacterium]MDD5395795.1 PHP-associated domain-containing protein [Patescibacteria group bacterium]
MVKAVFHIHSKYSSDSFSSLEKIAGFCQKKNINLVFLCDHNNLAPTTTINGVQIIGGEEIKTREGEIIGLFVKEKIEPNLLLAETIKKIKEQGGLVATPHPFNSLIRRWSGKKIQPENLLKNIDQIDIVEVFNARNIYPVDNKKALEFAEKNKKIKIVGSDAHVINEIDNTSFLIDNFSTPQEFLNNLSRAEFSTKTGSLVDQLKSLFVKIIKFF